MLDRGSGVVVNVASVLGLVGSGQIPQAGYVASKGGLVNLTRELAAQWARQGVRVNTLAPGWFRTETTEDRLFAGGRAGRWIRKRAPMGRGGDALERDGGLPLPARVARRSRTGPV